jgi:hypothetical protein
MSEQRTVKSQAREDPGLLTLVNRLVRQCHGARDFTGGAPEPLFKLTYYVSRGAETGNDHTRRARLQRLNAHTRPRMISSL